jgi:splicing factor 3B subunit 3
VPNPKGKFDELNMADISPSFSLYHLTLKQPSGSICSIVGNFSGSRKSQEIVRATQTTLELWQLNKSTKELTKTVSENSYCNISKISSYKYNESSKDLIILTSDSGMLTIIEFDPINNKFISIANESFYKTGIRRLSPNAYISADSKGRAVMISAIEKNKLVYTFTKDYDYSSKINIMSPIEANRNNLLTYGVVAMDVGFNANPIFAAIETDYKSTIQNDLKLLNYYEFDLGLNHVILTETETINYSSNHVVAVPGGLDGPSGILLCSEGMIQYKCPFKPSHYIPIPIRSNNSNIKSIIVSSVVHKMKNNFFILLQNQFGDIFKVTLDYTTTQETEHDELTNDVGPGMVTSMKIRYFDSIPVCTSLIILKSGYLFADCEHGDTLLYQFEKLGDDVDERELDSQDYPDEQAVFEEELVNIEFNLKDADNIILANVIPNMNPIIDIKLNQGDFINSLPELYSITGAGSKSAIRLSHNYIPLSEIVTQDLPSNILNAFTLKIHKSDEYDKFIILSFFDGSIILKIGDEVEEAENSGFIDSVTTLNAYQIGSDSIVQIHATGLRQIFYNESNEPIKTIDWNSPPGIEVLLSACTNTQVALALTNGDVVYFEISDSNDTLIEYSFHKEFNSSISSICIGEIPNGRIRAPYIVVTCKDSSVHILSTDPKNTMNTVYSTKLPTVAISAAITVHQDRIDDINEEEDGLEVDSNRKFIKEKNQVIHFVHFGLQNGVYIRYVFTDEGKLENLKSKFIMKSPLKIATIKVTNNLGKSSTFAVINSMLSFVVVPDSQNDIKLVPLPIPEKFIDIEQSDEDNNDELTPYSKNYGHIVSLHSQDVPQGLLLTHGERLTISSIPIFNNIDNLDKEGQIEKFILQRLKNLNNIENINLRYTPRAICNSLNKEYKMSYIACSDSNIASIFQNGDDKNNKEIINYGSIDDGKTAEFEKIQNFGYPTKYESYGSCIHVFSLENSAIGQTIELLNNEIAVRLGSATLEFNGKIGDYLLVSTIKNFKPMSSNSKFETCSIRVYHVEEDGSLSYVYEQNFKTPILAIQAFQGCVVLGFGDELGMYQLGKLQMLRKAGIKLKDYGIYEIVDLKTSGFRLFVSDIRNSVKVLVYDSQRGIFVPVVEDYINRHITRSCIVDHDTVFVGDKFGTMTVLRCPDTNLEFAKHINSNDISKFQMLMSFYVGDTITGLLHDKIGIGGEDVVIYSGINGTIGVFSAMKTVKEVNFFKELEKLVHNVLHGIHVIEAQHEELNNVESTKLLVDRDITKFRSYYVPKRACIDGDIIEKYLKLDHLSKKEIAESMERDIEQIEDKIIEMRSRIGY